MKKSLWFVCLTLLSVQLVKAQVSDFILVDQFGYTTNATKIAILRDPQTGYDASASYIPAANYVLVNTVNNTNVLTMTPTIWNGGTTDVASGDKVWWLDFSQVNTEGSYYIKESTTNVRSVNFVISDTVYKSVLKASVRMLFYQRAGIAKTAANAGAGWADGASHIGPLQDKNARLFNNKVLATEKDISGGWYDAGDYNQYTPWTANYVIELLKAYQENPTIWTDDYNIPESGNGIPDVIDEIKWGMDWLLKMNQSDGSSLCVLGRAHASPPSSGTTQSLYGPATTNATAKSAAAFALGATVFKKVNPTVFGAYATTLENRAKTAWTWVQANTNVQFANNSTSNGSQGLAAGNQETDDLGRLTARLEASVYLFELTNDVQYKTYFDANYAQMPLIAWYNYASQYYMNQQEVLMYYTKLSNATTSVVANIKTYSNNAFNKSGDFFAAFTTDAYRSFVKDYNWGSNSYKALYGNAFRSFAEYDFSPTNSADYKLKAEEYLHYIHGVNAMGFCYLTNMSSYGAEKSINEIYHTWFKDGSTKWDRVGTSTYGPAPGYLSGGAYTSYNWDACCPSSCGSTGNNALCTSTSITPPVGQPKHKSYKDFNNNWPLNSWSVTEPSLGYQTNYIRLLSKYVKNQSTTTTSVQNNQSIQLVVAFPNPAQSTIELSLDESIRKQSTNWEMQIINAVGATMYEGNYIGQSISIDHLSAGMYQIKISSSQYEYTTKFIKQ